MRVTLVVLAIVVGLLINGCIIQSSPSSASTTTTTLVTSVTVPPITTTTHKLIPPPRVKPPIPKSERWFLPILKLGPAAVEGFTCIIHRESTSTPTHPNLGDDNGNGGNTDTGEDSGIFQMNNGLRGIWDHYVLPHLHVVIWKATAYQQAWGAAHIYRLEHFFPWTKYDGCS